MSEPAQTLILRATEVGHAAPPPTREVGIVGMPRRVTRGGARDAGPPTLPVAAAPDDIVRVEFENGLALWMRADDLMRERGQRVVGRDAAGAVWTIDPAPRPGLTQRDDALAARGAERGALGLGIKVLEFFGVDLKKKSAALLGRTFEERQLKGQAPGLYRCSLEPGGALAPAPASGALPADRPMLVFLHGTMSSAMGSFGDLWSTATDDNGQAADAARKSIGARYGDDVYAFEHRSLTESPIQNALDLVGQLPVGAQLHLVSHSRGGLVGELLCLAERDRKDDPLQTGTLDQLFAADRTVAEQLGLGPLDGPAAAARDKAYADDRARLAQLVKLLDARKIRVRRFVRVACPARGTTLTSGRLDRWLSVVNLLTGNGLAADAADFLLAVVKERTDPRTLPGLEAMMPGSALTRLLQHPSLVTSADLSVIAGDVEGQGLWGQLKLLAVDWFYGSDHDLVVNTGSMFGGIRRPDGGSRFLRDQGERVIHFNYFANAKSIGWLVNGLAREDGSDGGFAPMGQAKQEEPRWRSAVRQSRAATAPRPLALVVPGTMGSALSVRGKSVWLSYWSLLRGGLADIGWGTADVQVGDILDDFYGPLLEHLARTHRVEFFAYDWRESVLDAAKRMAARLETLLPEAERTSQPVHIVAHSMGGLVSRAMIADGGAGAQVWRRITALAGSRLLMLGTPNRGSHEAVRWLTASNPTEAKLTLLDLDHDVNGIVDIVRRFPGMVELLPFDDPARFARAALWKQLRADIGAGWPIVDDAVLRAATATWALLQGAAPDPRFMVYVAGCQRATVTDYQVVEDETRSPRKRLDFIATPEGDGTVTWASGRLADVPMYYAPDTAHDELCSNADDRRIFRAYVELLTTGKTDQLPASPPDVARSATGEPVRFVLPPLPVTDDLPDEDAVRALSFSGGRPAKRGGAAPVSSVIEVSLRHGDLAYARHAVLAGHYLGDTIVSAELALDQRLHGALTRRRDLGLYPGASGSYAVFFNEEADGKPVGALVVGLGQVGELSPGQLESGVRDALLDYALQVIHRPDLRPPENPQPQGGPRRARASCLLVGTGAGALRLRDSIEAMLRGALAANRKLEAAELDQKVLIDRIEILEVYEDVALSAARELGDVLDSAVLGPSLRWSRRCIEEGEGRRQRRRFGSDGSWWQRLEIVLDAHGDRLRFIATTDKARAEESLAAGQLRLADSFIAQACGSAVSNADIAKTLFEMLLPNRLKESSPDQRDLVLLLDEDSARFPWEMLEDRWSHTGRPPAVAGGLLRQLKTTEFRIPAAHAYENTVFVVGNPNLDSWDTFADLPGARREAELVGRVFNERGYATLASIDERAETILGGLHSKAWRVLHLAGHGAHEFALTDDLPAPPSGGSAAAAVAPRLVSGMVIGRDTFLTPGDVDQMRYVPELVFVNCCYLGKTLSTGPARYNHLAANLGVQFIRMGVKAVIAAGWAVDDGAALTFAETFYRRMLAGDAFGDAVQTAREAAWAGHPGANTWGAYQCYGDPGYRLQRDPQTDSVTVQPAYFAPGELVTDLRNLAEATRMTSKEHNDDGAIVKRLREQIEALLQRIPDSERANGRDGWLDRADVCAALGFAYGEGRQFGDAVIWLDKSLGAAVGDCPIRAVEQHANFQVRLAVEEWTALHSGDGARRSSAARVRELHERQRAIADRIEASIRELDAINRRATTPDRLELLGGACRRLAWVQTESAPRVAALLEMAQYYRSAYDAGGQSDSYAFNNWAVACLLLASIDPAYEAGDWRAPLADMCDRQTQQTLALNEDDPSLWRSTGLADIEVVRLLLAATDAAKCSAHAERATELYRVAFERGASLREIASIQEYLDFLQELTSDWPAQVAASLAGVRRSLD